MLHSRQLYYPYGETRYASAAASAAGALPRVRRGLPTDFGFTGQREEAGFGLYDYHARFYDPALGRFISADTVVPNPANPQDLNRYAYVRNNPLRYIDPTGHVVHRGDPNREPDLDAPCQSCHTATWWPEKYHPSPEEKRETLLFMGGATVGYVVGGPLLADLAVEGVVLAKAAYSKATWWGTKKLIEWGWLGGGAEKAIDAGEKALEALSADGNPADEIETTAQTVQQVFRLSEHALQRMTERGVTLEQVQATLNSSEPFQYFHSGVWKTGFYDPVSRIFVGEVQGTITTVITNVKPQYIENLKRVIP